MTFPPECLKAVSVYHLATAGGSSQAYSAGGTITAAFLPMGDRAHAMLGGDYVDPHELYADASADVRVGDKLVIDSVNYYARKVFSAPFGRLAHRRVSISRDSHA